MKITIPRITPSLRRPFLQSDFLVIAIALGSLALLRSMHAVVPAPDGGYAGGNTAEGQNALLSLTSGGFNTAVGFLSLRNATTGSFNTGIGAGALLLSTSDNNTATGAGALLSNSTASGNTANGAFALLNNTTGSGNTAVGSFALQENTIGAANAAIGIGALDRNIEGSDNTAIGTDALFGNTSGSENTALGSHALEGNTIGINNTGIGLRALRFNTSGDRNIALGKDAGGGVTTASNVICIGTDVDGANIDDSCFIGNIRGALVAPDAAQVLIDSAGKLGTTSGSSRRFKTEIKQMDKASETLLALNPVTFRYKSDKTNTPQFGLIAEEVAKVNADLVVRDNKGQVYTVRYEAVNAMLLNEFLKEHRKVEDLETTVTQQQNQIQALITSLQKVNARVDAISYPQLLATSP